MADDQNSGNDNTKSYGSNFEQSGQGTPLDPSLQNGLNEVQNFIQAISEEANTLVAKLNQAKTPIGEMSRDFSKFRDSLRFAVETADDVTDRVKKLLDINKKFSTQGIAGLNKRSYAEVKKWLETLQKENEDLLKNNFLAPDQQKKMQNATMATSRAVGILSKKITEVGDEMQEIDEETFFEVARAAREATKDVAKLSSQVGHTVQATKILDQMWMKLGSRNAIKQIAETFAKTAQIRAEAKGMRLQARTAGAEGLGKAKTAFMQKYGLEGKSAAEIIAWRRSAAGQAATSVAGRGGAMGSMDKLFERMSDAEGGKLTKFIAGQAQKALDTGGGKALEGMLTEASGAVGEMGIAAETAGAELAALYEGLKAGAKIWDFFAQTDRNRDYFTRFGGAGGIGVGQTTRTSFENTQYNLQGRGMLMGAANLVGGPLRMTEKQNTELFQSIGDFGLSLDALTKRLDADQFTGAIRDRRAGVLGGTQAFAYGEGRAAGLDFKAAATENLKLMYDFAQTQEQIKTLFNRINIESRQSGISITKYLAIIDDLGSGFDRFHKSLQAVTDTMRILDATGMATSQDLKDALEAYIKAPEKSMEQTAAILQLSSQTQKDQAATALEQYGARLASEISKQIGGTLGAEGMNVTPEQLGTVENQEKVIHALEANTKIDAQTRSALVDSIRALMEQTRQTNNIVGVANHSIDAINAAANLGNPTQITKAIIQALALQQAKARGNVSTEQMLKFGPGALAQMTGGVFGTGDLQKSLLAQQYAADTQFANLKNQPGIYTGGELRGIYGNAARAGLVAPATATTTEAEMQKRLQGVATGTDQDKLYSLILNDFNTLLNTLDGATGANKALKESTDKQTKQIRTPEEMAEALSSAQEQLTEATKRLTTAVTNIYDWLRDKFGYATSDTTANMTDEQKKVAMGTASLQDKVFAGQDQLKYDLLFGQGDRWATFQKMMKMQFGSQDLSDQARMLGVVNQTPGAGGSSTTNNNTTILVGPQRDVVPSKQPMTRAGDTSGAVN